MDALHEDREDVQRSQSLAAPFSLPRIIDVSSVKERDNNLPVTNVVKEQVMLLGDMASSQQFQSFAIEHNQRPAGHYSEGTGVMTPSANKSTTLLPNQPASLLTCPLHLPMSTEVPVTPPATAAPDSRGPLPVTPSSQSAQAFAAQLYSVSSLGSDSAFPPAEVPTSDVWSHALVVFDKLFCVCFVPQSLRPLRIGELVRCEFCCSDNIATIVADVSSLVSSIQAEKETTEPIWGFNSPRASPTGATYRNSSPLYHGKPTCGLAADHLLSRLPSLIRRCTNRDKKRLYFSRLRSNDALAAVQHRLINVPIIAQATEYQVNFACAIIYLTGDRSQCVLSSEQFQDIGEALLKKLRCETVDFRFLGERHHEELHLTRALIGNQCSEVLYEKVMEHLRSQFGRPAQRATAPASTVKQQQATAIAPPPQQGQMMVKASSYGGSQVWTHSAAVPAMTSLSTAAILQSASRQQSTSSLSYALGTPIYVTQQQQTPQQQPPGIQMLPPSQSLSLVSSSSYSTIHHANPSNATYMTQHSNSSYYDNTPQLPPQQQQQQPMLSFSPNGVSSSPVYYVVPPPVTIQWDCAPGNMEHRQAHTPQQQQNFLQQVQPSQSPAQAHVSPTLVSRSDSAMTQQTLRSQAAYVQTSTLNSQGYQAVSYPFFFIA
ncbi:hypothetical protein ABL78_0356 [Leptomonas seymouri]|uniref:Uncharacterized protein n=1 Tax=Leptomonas seymouri TaxID=5684 RepID=A0A0N0P917_LEPSE|nr:hypothetical protein ABL78_0356 [Leptomonas seymouri]|eukprot:KPI90596.1 hypothetical protein ABL78_0356 [Leptomonas seymouri]